MCVYVCVCLCVCVYVCVCVCVCVLDSNISLLSVKLMNYVIFEAIIMKQIIQT